MWFYEPFASPSAPLSLSVSGRLSPSCPSCPRWRGRPSRRRRLLPRPRCTAGDDSQLPAAKRASLAVNISISANILTNRVICRGIRLIWYWIIWMNAPVSRRAQCMHVGCCVRRALLMVSAVRTKQRFASVVWPFTARLDSSWALRLVGWTAAAGDVTTAGIDS